MVKVYQAAFAVACCTALLDILGCLAVHEMALAGLNIIQPAENGTSHGFSNFYGICSTISPLSCLTNVQCNINASKVVFSAKEFEISRSQ